jgi:TonB-dependent receptor
MKLNTKALPLTSKALFTIVGGAVLINPVFAQEQQADELDTVVVTGIRGSLQASMDIKKNSSGIVDAISAEDIGKFPDTNLAESLQRITGVSIDRVNGEGSQVTVRGFGPNFNLVTLNGRQLPAASVGTITGNPTSAGSQGNSRSFDFSTLAAEGVSGLEVYKTGNAATPSGGMGATINIRTIKPLEGGNKSSIGVKAMMDEGSDNEITPEVSGLFSWANDGETFGVSAFASYQDRKSSVRGVSVEQFQFFKYDPGLSFLSAAEVANAPAQDALMALPTNIGISQADIERERINGMVTFQWAPSENTTITADAMYSSQTLAQDSLVPGMWFSRQFSYIEFNGSDVVATPVKVIEPVALPGGRGKDLFYANYDDNTKDESLTIGLNLNHKFNDAWSMTFDAATSSSESGGDGPERLQQHPYERRGGRRGLARCLLGQRRSDGDHRRARQRCKRPRQWQRRAGLSRYLHADVPHHRLDPGNRHRSVQPVGCLGPERGHQRQVRRGLDVHRDEHVPAADRGLPRWLGRGSGHSRV